MQIHEKLRFLREQNGLSQTEVAGYLGVGQTTYSRYESLKTYPDIFIIKKLSALYKIDVDTLLQDVDDPIVKISLSTEEIQALKSILKKVEAYEELWKLSGE